MSTDLRQSVENVAQAAKEAAKAAALAWAIWAKEAKEAAKAAAEEAAKKEFREAARSAAMAAAEAATRAQNAWNAAVREEAEAAVDAEDIVKNWVKIALLTQAQAENAAARAVIKVAEAKATSPSSLTYVAQATEAVKAAEVWAEADTEAKTWKEMAEIAS